jgi:hypothetical protein
MRLGMMFKVRWRRCGDSMKKAPDQVWGRVVLLICLSAPLFASGCRSTSSTAPQRFLGATSFIDIIATDGQPSFDTSSQLQLLKRDRILVAALKEHPNFRTRAPGIKMFQDEGETFYLVEGDLALDEDELALYLHRRAVAAGGVSTQPAGLVPLLGADNMPIRWQPETILTYCVLRRRFASEEEYRIVSDCLFAAARDWESICGIKFKHLTEFDDSLELRPRGVVFAVRGINAMGEFYAQAFFPSDPPFKRRILVDPSFFVPANPYDRVGVFRHELGHVLGFQHEHIRSGAPPICRRDAPEIFDPSKYDPQSVMHYFCGGAGSLELRFSAMDVEGAQAVYGPPSR